MVSGMWLLREFIPYRGLACVIPLISETSPDFVLTSVVTTRVWVSTKDPHLAPLGKLISTLGLEKHVPLNVWWKGNATGNSDYSFT
uniref:Reverse transcriptase n=1 Tax=Heterorhabditis bacteriophora TaxID=37862 RepID=A0A1I7W6M6_HETBA